MLSLATHEPNFRVLREDVFAQQAPRNTCRICGQIGHMAAQCTNQREENTKPAHDIKPFIFLDVAILREYLDGELRLSHSFYDLERAIDDWVLLIFFVGNDFLPHLPSLEIREGAIDTLLRIWKQELPRMGGYITDHGQLVLERVQIILEGLAKREDEIFRKRHEGVPNLCMRVIYKCLIHFASLHSRNTSGPSCQKTQTNGEGSRCDRRGPFIGFELDLWADCTCN